MSEQVVNSPLSDAAATQLPTSSSSTTLSSLASFTTAVSSIFTRKRSSPSSSQGSDPTPAREPPHHPLSPIPSDSNLRAAASPSSSSSPAHEPHTAPFETPHEHSDTRVIAPTGAIQLLASNPDLRESVLKEPGVSDLGAGIFHKEDGGWAPCLRVYSSSLEMGSRVAKVLVEATGMDVELVWSGTEKGSERREGKRRMRSGIFAGRGWESEKLVTTEPGENGTITFRQQVDETFRPLRGGVGMPQNPFKSSDPNLSKAPSHTSTVALCLDYMEQLQQFLKSKIDVKLSSEREEHPNETRLKGIVNFQGLPSSGATFDSAEIEIRSQLPFDKLDSITIAPLNAARTELGTTSVQTPISLKKTFTLLGSIANFFSASFSAERAATVATVTKKAEEPVTWESRPSLPRPGPEEISRRGVLRASQSPGGESVRCEGVSETFSLDVVLSKWQTNSLEAQQLPLIASAATIVTLPPRLFSFPIAILLFHQHEIGNLLEPASSSFRAKFHLSKAELEKEHCGSAPLVHSIVPVGLDSNNPAPSAILVGGLAAKYVESLLKYTIPTGDTLPPRPDLPRSKLKPWKKGGSTVQNIRDPPTPTLPAFRPTLFSSAVKEGLEPGGRSQMDLSWVQLADDSASRPWRGETGVVVNVGGPHGRANIGKVEGRPNAPTAYPLNPACNSRTRLFD